MARPPIDRDAYNATEIHWERLHAFARKVAAARTGLGEIGPWQLMKTEWRVGQGKIRYEWEVITYLLQPNGDLVYHRENWDETEWNPRLNFEVTERLFDRFDAGNFDYGMRREFEGDTFRDQFYGPIFPKRGIGLSARLKNLLPE